MWSTDCAQPNWSRHRRHGIENKRAYKCDSTGAAQSQDASDGVTRLHRHDCQSGRYPCATQEQVENVVRRGFSDVSMRLPIMKCFRSVHRGTGRGAGGGEGGCVYSGRRGAKLSQYCCQSVQYAAPLKAYTGWNELEVGRGVGRRYYEQSISMYFKVLSALWSISSSSKVMCWMVGWEKGESNAIFF